jgi:hypothetical protein
MSKGKAVSKALSVVLLGPLLVIVLQCYSVLEMSFVRCRYYRCLRGERLLFALLS